LNRVSIIGCGDLAQRTLVPCLQSSEGRSKIELVSVWSPLEADCRAMKAGIPGVHIATSLENLLEDPISDTVWILSPAREHVAQTLAVLAAGKHAYVQKPLASSLEEIDLIQAAADRNGCLVSAAPAIMTYPTIPMIRDRLESGKIGPLFAVSAPFMGWGGRDIDWPYDPSWRFQAGNGPLRDHGIYTLTTLHTLLGPPARISAMGGVRVSERTWRGKTITVQEPDNMAAILAYDSGVLATLNEAWCAGGSGYSFRFYGLEGSLETMAGTFEACPRGFVVRDRNGCEIERIDATTHPAIGAFFASAAPVNAHVWADVCDLAHCIMTGKEPDASPQNVRPIYATLDALYQSVQQAGC
jgi:predicted dehydrogenase